MLITKKVHKGLLVGRRSIIRMLKEKWQKPWCYGRPSTDRGKPATKNHIELFSVFHKIEYIAMISNICAVLQILKLLKPFTASRTCCCQLFQFKNSANRKKKKAFYLAFYLKNFTWQIHKQMGFFTIIDISNWFLQILMPHSQLTLFAAFARSAQKKCSKQKTNLFSKITAH